MRRRRPRDGAPRPAAAARWRRRTADEPPPRPVAGSTPRPQRPRHSPDTDLRRVPHGTRRPTCWSGWCGRPTASSGGPKGPWPGCVALPGVGRMPPGGGAPACLRSGHSGHRLRPTPSRPSLRADIPNGVAGRPQPMCEDRGLPVTRGPRREPTKDIENHLPKKIRVYELARELGLTQQGGLDLALSLGIGVKSHSSSIEDAQADRVRRKADAEGLRRVVTPEEPPPPPAAARQESRRQDDLVVGTRTADGLDKRHRRHGRRGAATPHQQPADRDDRRARRPPARPHRAGAPTRQRRPRRPPRRRHRRPLPPAPRRPPAPRHRRAPPAAAPQRQGQRLPACGRAASPAAAPPHPPRPRARPGGTSGRRRPPRRSPRPRQHLPAAGAHPRRRRHRRAAPPRRP